jgi:hypothetical protein
MRPQITFPSNLKRALNYHEKKVQNGCAKLIHAHSFFKLPSELNFHDKINRFKELLALNERAETKLIHISLNFHPSEKDRLTEDFFVHLADEYMNKIGFGNQPYLVYHHEDAGHPHIHVLSSLIKDDGKRIPTHYIAKNLSEPVRKEMEKEYGFIPADKKEQQREDERQLSVTPQKIQAGKSATMRSITNVLDHVIKQYKYASLNELNAILKLYNVKADRGAEDGRIYKHRGLTYVVIDQDGKSLTKPIKASAFHSKPTLDYIEGRFKVNEQKRLPDKKHVKTAIDWAMQSAPRTLGELAKLLQKDRINLVIRSNEQARIYGITYIDHEKKTVFNGSDLGKEYSAKRMLERLSLDQPRVEKEQQKENEKDLHQNTIPQLMTSHSEGRQQTENHQPSLPGKEQVLDKESVQDEEGNRKAARIIEQIVGPDYGNGAINKDLLTEEERKKKKNFEKNWEM